MKKVLILGASGMLGSMVLDFFNKHNKFEIKASVRNKHSIIENFDPKIWIYFDAQKNVKKQLTKITKDYLPDYIINCIGIIKPYCKDDDSKGRYLATKVNALFPLILADFFNENYPDSKIIQIATDCVYQGNKGYYNENDYHDAFDVYGKSKSLGENNLPNILNIRTSIIGPELKNKVSLLEWFLSQKEENKIFGFKHHLWNGVTTLQFAQLCLDIIKNDKFIELRNKNHVLHYVVNEDVSKDELLNIFKKIFIHKVYIEATDTVGNPINRTLRSKLLQLPLNPMENAIKELKAYMDASELFNLKKG